MDDSLAKPVTLEKIGAVLARWGHVPHPTGPNLGARPAKASPREIWIAPVEEKALAAIVAMNPSQGREVLQRIISLYLDSSAKLVAEARQAAKAGDAETLHRAAHTLKSSSATLGAMQLSKIARVLELQGQGGHGRG
jgi:hypothetical protein